MSACGSSGGGGGTITTVAKPFCSSVISHSSSVTITGSAEYQFRTNGNGSVDGSNNPIRLAEIIVTDNGGNTIQCGATDASGNFSVQVPDSGSTYTLSINSRIISGMTQTYILDNPSDKDHYQISTNFVADATKSVGTLVASATGTLEGGAFNILDKILDANIFLETETNNCTASFSTCVPFSTTPLVSVFWTPGLNPGDYFNISPVSFYLPGRDELYILGGDNGFIQGEDADHFDTSIILHEYGHFIEDNFSATNSPGGSHNGNSVIDPRLAWGEGWANFFQAAMVDNPVYRDTFGNADSGSTGVFFNQSLETPDIDIPTVLGQGNFRQFSISRVLWDAIDSANSESGADLVTTSFAELWTVFAGTTGFASSAQRFRNMGLFHVIQQGLTGGTDWSSLRTAENQRGDQTDYGSITTTAACTPSPIPIQAANTPGGFSENGTASRSNPLDSNDFYRIDHPGGAFSFAISYTTDASNQADLDLYVFQSGYNMSNSTGIVAQSLGTPSAGAGPHAVSVSTSLGAGTYLVNVRVNTASGLGNNTQYTMTYNGAALCTNN